jgi:hypothetical protein
MNSVARLWRLASPDDAGNERHGRASKPDPREGDEFPYSVEILNYTGAFVQQTLAITISKSVGFAAYYAAVELFPEGSIMLRHKDGVLARWNARRQ